MKKLRMISLVLLSLVLVTSCASLADSNSESVATVSKTQPLGIMSAMDVELNYLLSQADINEVISIGDNDFNVGTLEGQDVVIVKAGVGKSLSAAATAIMCNNFNVSAIVFTGIAGGVAPQVEIADVVISTNVFFHDYGCLGNDDKIDLTTDFVTMVDIIANPELEKQAYNAAVEVLGEYRVFEGASVGYVASKYNVPFVIIRSLNDKADSLAHESYDN
ncbi:MAG: 5'-methylthioadenosine/S-adenosylhomocysteine nucleosidase [Spirochaetaceae bacterium]|nr:5'-methylthioadenosine/S-adenosylhomocysteine nucleosidase [Spirochaetaceae bacterium]